MTVGRATLVYSILVAVLAGCPRTEMADPRVGQVEVSLLPTTIIAGEEALTLADRMEHYRVPGVSIAVIGDFEIQWVRHYGVADVRGHEPVTDETLFNVGSLSKAVTAMTALSLARDGLIDLDADVNRQLRSWRLPDNEYTSRSAVTPIRLMNHSGGVRFSPPFSYHADDLPTLRQLLDGIPPSRSEPVEVDVEPGTRFQYSNAGYSVLRQLIEDVSGQPFAEVVADRIFAPLGMTRSTFKTPLPQTDLDHAAMGHRANGEIDAELRRWYGHVAAGGLWTTATEYATLVIELEKTLRGDSETILTRELAKDMVRSHDSEVYGLGVFLLNAEGKREYFGHIGDAPGFVGGFLSHKHDGIAAVILTNGQQGINLVRETQRGIAQVYEWPSLLPPAVVPVELEASQLAQASGRYRLGFDRVVALEVEGGSLWLELPEMTRTRLFAVGERTFVSRERSGNIVLSPEQDGRVEQIEFHLSDEYGRLSESSRIATRMAAGERTPLDLLFEGEIEAATSRYRQLMEREPSHSAVSETNLDQLGYWLLARQRPADAVAVFRLCVALYPASGNAHDSLGEGLMETGQTVFAIESYRRSLEIDPSNTNASDKLRQLEDRLSKGAAKVPGT